MNKILSILFSFCLSSLLGCSDQVSFHSGKSSSKVQQQANIKESYNRDDFDFSQFAHIDWQDLHSYGPPCSGACVEPTKRPIPEHLIIPSMGITQDNYYVVDIKGDGSCWMRAAIQALLYQAFLQPNHFISLISNITKVKETYADIEGFNERFRSDDLKTLLTTLNGLSSQERLVQYNKAKIDLFLDYSMRALLHAIKSKKLNFENQNYRKNALQKILQSHSVGDASQTVQALAADLLDFDPIFASYADAWPGKQIAQIYFLFRGGIAMGKVGEAGVARYNTILSSDMRSLAEVRSAKDYSAELTKELQNHWGIKSFAELHRLPPFGVLPMLQTKNHYAVMVHKDATKAFGYQ
jgi:hypothetical protein